MSRSARRNLLLGAALALGLAGCQQDVSISHGRPSKDLQSCASSGGSLQARGKSRQMTCVHRYGDAGKSCSSRSDCQGRCIADGSEGALPTLGEKVTGRCQADDKLFGCYAEIDGGKAKSAICVD